MRPAPKEISIARRVYVVSAMPLRGANRPRNKWFGPSDTCRCRPKFRRTSDFSPFLCRTALASPLFVILYFINGRPRWALRPDQNSERELAMRASTSHQSTSRGISFASAAFAVAWLLSGAASDIATAEPAVSGTPARSAADDQMVRRCEWRSKQEHCYWVKPGVQSASQR
jgi:hypothetical protein